MRVGRRVVLLFLLCLSAPAPCARADTYAAFQTTRHYSADRRYFVEVREDRRATLYCNGRRLRRVWSRTLAGLPQKLFVAVGGRRVAVFERYYGNGRAPETPVVVVLDGRGRELAAHRLGDLADLKRVMQTISAAHWYRDARLSADGAALVVETHVTKLGWDECHAGRQPADVEKCWETIPHERLWFALSSGALVGRESLAPR